MDSRYLSKFSIRMSLIFPFIFFNYLTTFSQIGIDNIPPRIPNNSIYLDGINDFMEINHHNSLNIFEDITIEAWIKPDSIGPEKTILIKGTSGQCQNYGIFLKEGKLAYVSGGDCGWKGTSEKTVIRQGIWQHVAVVGKGNILYFYLNGIQKDSIYLYNTIGSINSDPLWIGKSSGVLNNAFAGKIDDLRIWNKARSKKQIKNNIYRELSGNELGLILYFKFTEDEFGSNDYSKLISDKTKNKNDGLIYNYERKTKKTNLVKSENTSLIQPTQTHNASINESYNHLFISTLDGLNISNGIATKVYKQSTHNMIGNILQGDIFKDKEEYIWFTTNNALHRYLPEIDDFEAYQFTNSNGESITTDYRFIKEISDDKILIKLKHELIIFDVKLKKLIKNYVLDLFKYSKIDATITDTNQLFIAGNNKGLNIYQKKENGFETTNINIPIESILLQNTNLWLGTIDGYIAKIDTKSKKETFRKKIDNCRIMDIQYIYHNRLLITSKERITILDLQSMCITEQFTIQHPISEVKLDYLLKPYISKDSILWVGNDGLGLFSLNIKKPKFTHWKKLSNFDSNFKATKILESPKDKSFYLCSRSNGLTKIDSNGYILKEYGNNSNTSSGIKFAIWKDSMTIFASNFNNLLSFNIEKESFEKILLPYNEIGQINKDKKQNIFSSAYKSFLIKLIKNNDLWTYDTIAICPPNIKNPTYTYFFFDNENKLYIDNNIENILVFDSTHNNFIKKIDLDGGLLSLYDLGKKLLLTNYNGLFEIDKSDYSHKQIIDKENKLLQQIYGVLVDKNGYYWLSTNNGLYSYDPKTNHAHQFKNKDGLQGQEFNTMSYFENSNGEFMFGGENGINIFDPLKVKLSDKQAPIDFYNYKINDEDSQEFGVANYVDEVVLDYDNNTISFEFVGIDFEDPNSVNLKYFMKGKDKHWVELDENKGFARYSNLPPGNYTFNMLASNADEVWADQPKQVKIKVLPPWWKTWWFRLLALLSISSMVYLVFIFYYKRKIHEKDLQLREQNLIISKQQALEAERTRIASEMHDDLGGALTTIRFLSQKILRNIKNEANRSSINKIVRNSQELVTNMSEIIWAMNAGYDTLDSLLAYTRRYAFEYLGEHNLELKFSTKGKIEKHKLSGEKRRNIYLVIKEALHNVVKHADASVVKITFEVNDHLHIYIKDNGKEFPNEKNLLGNGIKNMKNRIEKLNGEIQFTSKNGTIIVITIPLERNI